MYWNIDINIMLNFTNKKLIEMRTKCLRIFIDRYSPFEFMLSHTAYRFSQFPFGIPLGTHMCIEQLMQEDHKCFGLAFVK